MDELLRSDGDDQPTCNVDEEGKSCGYVALMDGKIPPCAGLSSSSAVVVAAALCKGAIWTKY